MDASALERLLDSLEKSWSSLDWWLNFWTVLVVVGVAVELVVLIIEYTRDWHDFKRGAIHAPDKPSLLVFGLGFTGAALVAFGVAGEFREHIKAGKIESDMREATRQLVALVQGDAKERASANERQTAQLRKDAEILKGNNLALEAEVLKLREEMADRHLTRDQQRTVANKLRRYAGHKIAVYMYSGDPEILGIAQDIASALGGPNGAGWTVTASREQATRPIPGILVELRGGTTVDQDAAKALVSALKDQRLSIEGPQSVGGFEAHATFGGNADNSAPIVMTIGKKP
jgi:hypothetical protein